MYRKGLFLRYYPRANIYNLKQIKKNLKILFKWLKYLVLFLVFLIITFSIPVVQTRLARLVTENLNEDFGTNLKISKVDLSLLGSVSLRGIEIKDHHQDTLIYVERLRSSLLDVKRILEKLFVILFSIQTETVSFLTAKSIYTHTISLWTFPVLILFFYAALPNQILFGFILFLFVIKLALLFANNKNLILSKLFYIILYICAFEIAPPFLLFKLMF